VIPGNIVFRHSKLSANFGYLDGHVENLKTIDVDAARMIVYDFYTVIGIDPRTNLTP
jgi:prepilin-type processing-associated H-X9-DG protein